MSLELPVSFIRDTDKAWYVIDQRTGELLWLPKSHTKVAKALAFDCNGKRTGVVTVSDFIASEKGLL